MVAFTGAPVSIPSARRPSCVSQPLSVRPFFSMPRPGRSVRLAAKAPAMVFGGGGRGGPAVPVQERALSVLPYLIPLLDSLSFGFYVFRRVPLAGTLILTPLYPLYQVYRGVPFLAFGVFLVLYTLVVRNQNIPRFVRFNTYQALMLDIVLIIPQLFSGMNVRGVVPQQVVELLSTSVFYAMSIAIGYAVINNAKGELPDQIPAISDSVRDQVGKVKKRGKA